MFYFAKIILILPIIFTSFSAFSAMKKEWALKIFADDHCDYSYATTENKKESFVYCADSTLGGAYYLDTQVSPTQLMLSDFTESIHNLDEYDFLQPTLIALNKSKKIVFHSTGMVLLSDKNLGVMTTDASIDMKKTHLDFHEMKSYALSSDQKKLVVLYSTIDRKNDHKLGVGVDVFSLENGIQFEKTLFERAIDVPNLDFLKAEIRFTEEAAQNQLFFGYQILDGKQAFHTQFWDLTTYSLVQEKDLYSPPVCGQDDVYCTYRFEFTDSKKTPGSFFIYTIKALHDSPDLKFDYFMGVYNIKLEPVWNKSYSMIPSDEDEFSVESFHHKIGKIALSTYSQQEKGMVIEILNLATGALEKTLKAPVDTKFGYSFFPSFSSGLGQYFLVSTLSSQKKEGFVVYDLLNDTVTLSPSGAYITENTKVDYSLDPSPSTLLIQYAYDNLFQFDLISKTASPIYENCTYDIDPEFNYEEDLIVLNENFSSNGSCEFHLNQKSSAGGPSLVSLKKPIPELLTQDVNISKDERIRNIFPDQKGGLYLLNDEHLSFWKF